MSFESVMPSNWLILCHLLLLPPVFPNISVFSNESALCLRCPKFWCFSSSISPSNEYSGLSSLQSKGLSRVISNNTVQKHQFFSAQYSLWSNSHILHDCRKTIALTIQNFVGKLMSLLFNTLSRFVVTFLPRSKLAAVTICSDFGAQENKICHCLHFPPFYLSWNDGTRCHDLHVLKVEL